jgi:hypothetical protein
LVITVLSVTVRSFVSPVSVSVGCCGALPELPEDAAEASAAVLPAAADVPFAAALPAAPAASFATVPTLMVTVSPLIAEISP